MNTYSAGTHPFTTYVLLLNYVIVCNNKIYILGVFFFLKYIFRLEEGLCLTGDVDRSLSWWPDPSLAAFASSPPACYNETQVKLRWLPASPETYRFDFSFHSFISAAPWLLSK